MWVGHEAVLINSFYLHRERFGAIQKISTYNTFSEMKNRIKQENGHQKLHLQVIFQTLWNELCSYAICSCGHCIQPSVTKQTIRSEWATSNVQKLRLAHSGQCPY